MKKFLSFILVLTLVLTMAVPVSAKTLTVEDTISDFYQAKPMKYFYQIEADEVQKVEDTLVEFQSYWYTDTYEVSGPAVVRANQEIINAGMGMTLIHTDSVQALNSYQFSDYFPRDETAKDGIGIDFYLERPGVYFFSGYVGAYPAKTNIVVVVKDFEPEYELKAFSDVPSSKWSHKAIMEMVEMGMFEGTTKPDANGMAKFSPEDPMTTAQFLAVVTRYLYPEKLDYMIEGENWYDKYYDLATMEGIVKSTEIWEDELDKPLSREKMAMIAVRVMQKKGEDIDVEVDDSQIADIANVGAYYKGFAKTAFAKGILTGYDDKGTFHSEWNLSREEAAMVAYRLVNPDARIMPK